MGTEVIGSYILGAGNLAWISDLSNDYDGC